MPSGIKRTKENINDQFLKENKQFEIIGDYKTIATKTDILCKNCNKIFFAEPRGLIFRRNKICWNCYKNENYYTEEQYKKELENTTWELLDEFSHITKPYNFICKKCKTNHTMYGMAPKTQKCKVCENKNKNNIIKQKIYQLNPNIIFQEEIYSVLHKYKCKCLICSYEYRTSPGIILSGCGCPQCNIIRQRNLTLEVNEYLGVNYKQYKMKCRKIQRYNITDYKLFDMSDVKKYMYHIDHIYSLRNAFDNNVPAYIVSSPVNMQKLWWSDNITKHKKSPITLEILIEKYNIWVESQGGETEYLKRISKNILNLNNKNVL
jgi:hypothetical protein